MSDRTTFSRRGAPAGWAAPRRPPNAHAPGSGEWGWYQRSLTVARAQGAKWLELRTARGYAHYMLKQERTEEAHALLSPVVDWFSEGHNTLDYMYADALRRTMA